MKKTILILLLFAFGMIASAQSISIWKPVPSDLFKTEGLKVGTGTPGTFLFRWSVTTNAVQFAYNKDTKQFDVSSLSKVGIGISYAHFIPVNDVPYNDFSISAYAFTPAQNDGKGLSVAVIASALKFANISPGIGAGYDWGLKAPILLINAVVTF